MNSEEPRCEHCDELARLANYYYELWSFSEARLAAAHERIEQLRETQNKESGVPF